MKMKASNGTALSIARPLMVLTLAGALSACSLIGKGGNDSKPKTPVLGNRVSILTNDREIEADPTLAGVPVSVPAAYVNTDWPQPGGNSAKSIGNVALADQPRQIWSTSVTGTSKTARLGASPVISGDKIFALDTRGQVHAFNAATGAKLWQTEIPVKRNSSSQFGGGASVEGDKIFVTTGTGQVASLNTANGAINWKIDLGEPLRGSPTLFNGQLYIISQDNQLFALSQTDGSTQWTESGTLQATGVFGVAAPAAGQGTVIAGFSSGELSAYRYENGRSLWEDALARTTISMAVASLADIDADPVIDRGRVFAIGQGGRMASYELVSGQRLWEVNVGGISTPTVAGEWVFAVTSDARLLCVSRTTGKIRYMRQLPRWRDQNSRKGAIRWTGPLLAGNNLILVSSRGDLAYADPATGDPRAIIDIGRSMTLRPVVANQIMYILADSGQLMAYR